MDTLWPSITDAGIYLIASAPILGLLCNYICTCDYRVPPKAFTKPIEQRCEAGPHKHPRTLGNADALRLAGNPALTSAVVARLDTDGGDVSSSCTYIYTSMYVYM